MMENIGLSVEVRTLETNNYSKVPKSTTCAVCGKQFTDPNNCHKHYLRHGQNKGNECEICYHLFQGKQQKLQHMMFEHGVEQYEYKCQICELIFNKMEDLRRHSIDVHDSGDQCRICWLLFKSKEGLQAHMDHHVETNTALPCETCGKYYRDKFSLKLHMRSHTGEKPFECPNCPEKFTARMYLFRHIESKHVKETPYHCELCNVSFKTIIQLRSHVKTKMHVCNQTSNEPPPEKPEVPKPFQCNKCSKSFALQTYLTVHKRIHSGVKPYYCPICSRGFVQVGNMNSHIKRMHQPKISKPEADRLKCSECHKSFCHTRAYKYHMRSHRRSQLHTCRYCDKQFNHLPKFKMHEASHNPDSHIKCHTCQKVFFSWGNLNRHKKCCTFKKGRKQKIKSIKREFAEDSDVDCEDLEEMSDIVEEELNQTLTKIIKSEPVWEGEESVWNINQPSVQVGRSVLTIKSSRPNLTTTDTTEPSFNTSFSEDGVHETQTGDTDSFQNIITIDPSSDYEVGGLKTILSNQNISANSRQQSEKWSNPGAELTSPITSNSKRKHSPQLDRHSTIYNSWQEEVTPSPALLDHFYQIGSPERPQGPSVSTSSQLYKFLAPESDFTTNQPSGVDATPLLKSSKKISTAHQDNQETAQSVSSILNFMDADDANSTLKTELTEMVNVNEMVQGTVDPSSKNTRVIYFKVHDQLMELQYFDPETEIVEEVATSKDLENVIPSVGTSSDVMDIMSPTTKFIEIKDLSQVQEDNSAYTVPDNGRVQSNSPRVFRIDEYDNRIPPKPLQISTDSMTCSICYKPFKDKSNLKHHMKRHNQNKGNECDICRKLFQGRQQVFQHKMAEHNIKPENLTCEICGVVKAGTNDLRTHSREIHSFDYPYECSFCFKRYKNEQDYETHVEFHVKAYPCDRCDKSYDSAKLLGHHYRSHTGERPHECEMCNKTFILMSHLRAHEMTHLEVRPFLCTYCSKSFICQRRLNEHQRTHEKEKTPSNGKGRKKSVKNSGRTFTCSMCTKTFQQQTYLTIHMRTHKNERPYSCPVCGKRFGQNGNMLKHWQTHTRQKLTDWLICEICDMKFRSEADYTRHQVTKHLHNSEVPKVSKRRESPLECSICGDIFDSKSSLKRHMETHEGSNAIICKLCCTSVGNNQTLKTHLEEYHNAEYPFECGVCRRRYSDQSKLDFHVKTHLEKPLTCKHCDKRYSNLKSLQNHLALHTDENEYECKICAKKFIIKGNLTRHLKSHNAVSVNSSPLTSVSTNKNVQIVISAEDSYKCVDCEEKFENKENFLEHVKTHKTVSLKQNI